MGVEKTDSKGNGFFNLFDWNKKARKKLFPNGSSSSSEKAEMGKEVDDNMANSVPRLIGEDGMAGISSIKGSSDYSYASSLNDEGTGLRPPGVVARLMGLDSMPTTGVCEPYSTPLHDSRSLQERRDHEIYINDHLVKGTEAYFRGSVELRSQKMPSSLVERFQTETLTPRSSKTISMTHYKLLSPIRNHTFISGRDAAHIMEVATKILEPGCQTNSTGKGQSFQSFSSPLRIYHSKETARKTSGLQELSRRPLEPASMRSLRGKPLNKGTNDLNYATDFRSLYMDGTDLAVSRGKAKPTVQIRDGAGNNRKALIQKVSNERKLNEPSRSQSNNQKNNNQKRTAINSSSVLRQNNSKQNYLVSKDKLTSKPIVPKQQGEQILSRDASSGGKVRTVSKLPGSTRVGYRKDGSGPSNLVKEMSRLSSSSNFSRTNKMMEGRISGERESSDNISVNINKKCTQHNVVVDEQSNWSKDGRKTNTEIVSFTFTSPANISLPGSRFPTHMEVKQDIENGCSLNTCCPNYGIDSDNKNLSSGILNEMDGDYLGVLLEQKLKELTSGDASPYRKSVKGISIAGSPPALRKAASPCETSVTRPADCENRSLRSCKDELIGIFPMNTPLANDQVCRLRHDAQESERMEYISNSEDQKDPEHQHLSPLSVFEASFSNESCISSDSLESLKGTKISYFGEGVRALDASCFTKVLEVESEMELFDLATSNVVATTIVEPASEISNSHNMDSFKEGLDFVREILNALSISDNISSYKVDQAGEVLDPVLFDELEDNRRLIAFEGEEKDYRMRRKMFFDCVNESLDLKCSHYFQAGYRLWAKGVSVLGKDLAEELYKEMQGWKSIGDWMVDELVDRDMSNHLGRWVDFEIESFEAGVEIERGILSSLVDEVVADLLNQVTL